MANNILNKVAGELTILEQQLKDFKSSVDYLKAAKVSVDIAVNTIKEAENYHLEKIVEIQTVYDGFERILSDVKVLSEKVSSVDFPKRLNTIELRLDEVIKEIEQGLKVSLEEVKLASKAITKVDFDTKFKNLETIINGAKTNIDSSKVKIETGLANVHQKNTEYAAKVQAAVEESNNAVVKALKDINFSTRMEKLDANIAGIMTGIQSTQSRLDNLERNITDRLKDITDRQKESQNILLASMNSAGKRQQVFTYITWTLIVATIIVIKLIIKP